MPPHKLIFRLCLSCCLITTVNSIIYTQEARLVLPVGHTSIISATEISPDGRFVLSGSWDNTAKIWEAGSGLLLKELKGHSASITSVRYSPDGNYVFTASKDSSLRAWSALTGQLIWKSKAHPDWVTQIACNPDGRSVFTGSADGSVLQWDIVTGKNIKTLVQHKQWISSIYFTRQNKWWVTASWDSTAIVRNTTDGSIYFQSSPLAGRLRSAFFADQDKLLVAATDQQTIYVWSLAEKRVIHTMRIDDGTIWKVRLSPDGQSIITGSSKGMLTIWSISNGKKTMEWHAHNGSINDIAISSDQQWLASAGADSQTIIWNWKDGSYLQPIKSVTSEVNNLRFFPNNHYLLATAFDNNLYSWSIIDAREQAKFTGHTFWANEINYNDSGNLAVTASNDNAARIWDASGGLLQTLSGHSDWVNTAVFSKNGKYILTASNDHTARLWQTNDGSLLNTFSGHEDWVNSAVFSPDGNTILTASSDNTAKIWLRSNGKLLYNLEGHTDWVNTASFSSDGKWAITASMDNTVRIWDVSNGRQVMQLAGSKDSLRSAAFSPDGNFVVTTSKDYSVKIWKRNDGTLLYNLKGHTEWVNKVLFSPDGKMVASLSQDNTIKLWNIQNGDLIYSLDKHTAGISDAIFSNDGQFLFTSSWDQTVKCWNLNTGTLAWDGKGHTGSVNNIDLSPDGKFLLSVSEDNTMRKWNTETGEWLYSFFPIDQSDYLVIDPRGRYDGTPSARQMLYYVCGNELVELEQIKELAWEPGLAKKLSGLNPEPVTALKTEELPICNYIPEIKSLGLLNGEYRFEIKPKSGGLGEVQVFVNSKMIKQYLPGAIVKKGNLYQLSVKSSLVAPYFVSGSGNEGKVKATTQAGTLSSRGAVISVADTKKRINPNMYVVSIGVSRYKTEKLLLKYAAKDARELGAAISISGQKLLNSDKKQHVYQYILNTDSSSKQWPTKKNIRRVMDSVIKKARPDDVVVIFFAGHGMLYKTAKTFYLLTTEANGFDIDGVEKQVAISGEELNEWMAAIKANKQVLILDACNSGMIIQRVKEVMGRREVPADQQRALERLKDKTGTFILSAAATDQSAYETSLYQQGLLTYSLLTGLKLGQGLKDNKFIDVNRWFNFAADNVKILAKDIGGRQDPQIIGNGSFDLGLVDKEVSDGIHLSIRRKIFRESRFIQDEQLLNDDLDLADLIDRELDNLSLSGRESPLIFVAGNKLQDAYSIRGRYDVKDSVITVQAWVVKGSNERVLSLQMSGTLDGINKMVQQMMEELRAYFKNHE